MCGRVGFSEIIQGSHIAICQNQWALHGPRPQALSHYGMNGALRSTECSEDTQPISLWPWRVMSDLNSTLHEELFSQHSPALTQHWPIRGQCSGHVTHHWPIRGQDTVTPGHARTHTQGQSVTTNKASVLRFLISKREKGVNSCIELLLEKYPTLIFALERKEKGREEELGNTKAMMSWASKQMSRLHLPGPAWATLDR